jgi:uncharacterized lipoprotein YajG
MKSLRTIFLLVGFAFLVGCGSGSTGPAEVVVVGEVHLDGKMLTMGEVFFISDDGQRSASGEIGGDGKYRVPSAPVGSVKAAVRTASFSRFAGNKTKDGKAITMGGREGTYVPVPKHYEDVSTSKLTYTIANKSEVNIKIELTSK